MERIKNFFNGGYWAGYSIGSIIITTPFCMFGILVALVVVAYRQNLPQPINEVQMQVMQQQATNELVIVPTPMPTEVMEFFITENCVGPTKECVNLLYGNSVFSNSSTPNPEWLGLLPQMKTLIICEDNTSMYFQSAEQLNEKLKESQVLCPGIYTVAISAELDKGYGISLKEYMVQHGIDFHGDPP